MKIVIASDLYWPMVNGVSTFCRSLAQNLVKNGHEVMILASSQTGDFSIGEEDGCTVVRFDSVKFPFHPNQVDPLPDQVKVFNQIPVPRVFYANGLRVCLSPYRKIKKVLDDFQPDVIHGHTPLMIGLAVGRYAKLRNVPLVCTTHTFPDNTTGNLWFIYPIKKPVDYLVKSHCAKVLVNSNYATMPTKMVMDALLPAHIKKNLKIPVEALQNGVDLSRFSPGPVPKDTYKKFNLPEDKPIISYIGRLDKEKSIGVVVRAFQQVLKSKPAHLLLVGDGADKDDLKSLVKKLGLTDHVTFTGKVVGDDLVNLHRIGTVFCTASVTEVQSIALLESMACGQPVVVIDVDSMKELCKDGINGYMCEEKNVDQIAGRLLKVISDKKLRDKMGKESIKIASTFDIKYSVQKFEQIYKKAIRSCQEKTKAN